MSLPLVGALGEIITEKSGNLNLGVPGIMYFGGIAGLTSTFMYENVYCVNAGIEPSAALCVIMCLVASFLASALGGLIYSFLTITLRTNQNVTGLALTMFGTGFGTAKVPEITPSVALPIAFVSSTLVRSPCASVLQTPRFTVPKSDSVFFSRNPTEHASAVKSLRNPPSCRNAS